MSGWTDPWRRPIDLWRPAILRRPAAGLSQRDLLASELIWLPPTRPYAFRADPFGLWRDDRLYLFVEAFDYRRMVGRIEVLVYDESLALIESRTVLAEPWHLSYPYVFEAEGELWMLPEASRSGRLRLYRARSFPGDWEVACEIDVDPRAVDATPLFYQGRWWLFFAVMRHRPVRSGELHLAWADHLTGPWHSHPGNPVRIDAASTRPGGTPLIGDAGIDLPVQDCSRTYGGAIRRLSITRMDGAGFAASDAPWLDPVPALAPYTDGIHTLAAVGPVTLLDFKRIDRSWSGTAMRRFGLARRKLSRRTQ
jgi:hypothetical protein